jgi:hypothetical protein
MNPNAIDFVHVLPEGLSVRRLGGKQVTLITYQGQTNDIFWWAKRLGLSWRTLRDRLLRQKMPLAEALTPDRVQTHGLSHLPEYRIWLGMKRRCNDELCKDYLNYGGRGIKVCPEWMDDFQAFYDHIGPRPTLYHSIDRIENSRGYEPGNVRWATKREQQRNTRYNVFLEYQGRTQVLTDWAKEYGLTVTLVWTRLFRYKWTLERALTTPAPKPEPRKAEVMASMQNQTAEVTANG